MKIGSEHPVALQTMTTTDTRNIQATVDQVRAAVPAQQWPTPGGPVGGACRVPGGA